MAIIFCGVLFYLNPKMGLIGLLFAIILILPVVFKLYSVRSNINVKYKTKEEKE